MSIDLYARQLAKSALAGSNVDQEFDPQSTSAQSGYAVAEAVRNVVDIGSYQYSYGGHILPSIPVATLKQIYSNDESGLSQTLKWEISQYGLQNNLKVISSDLIAGVYSIDVLVHNQFHCAYTWDDSTSGNVNPSVMPKDWELISPEAESGFYLIDMEEYTELQAIITNLTSSTISINVLFYTNLQETVYNGTSLSILTSSAGPQIWEYEKVKTIGYEKFHKLDTTTIDRSFHDPLAKYISFPVNSNITYKFYVK